ncbi:MAG TPA: tRNA (N6-threonylcarbamoyladenosine(37)-N6)-methyltransferase TrmO [Planctomycetota bacterium]|nr:tRNA (N6-threonylcarbamoyladenosine(37)-N6)-methyltransferase TrmO [Planctomycetota bacterium]
MTTTETAAGGLEQLAVKPVGYVQSDYLKPQDVRHEHTGWTRDISRIRMEPDYAKLLGGLTGYSHIIVLFWVHKASEWKMPRGHHKPAGVKVFATRMPRRPNPIGLSVVELLSFSTQTGEVVVKGLDALDGTPVLDIKPYIPNFDSCPTASVPPWVAEHLNSHFHGGPHGHHHDAEKKSTPTG